MTITMLKAKIHRAVVTEANLNYVGSITVDQDLLDAAGILVYEKVHIMDIDNGNRFTTYAIAGKRGAGDICLNGAAARLVHTGDRIIIMAFCEIDAAMAPAHRPRLVFVGENGNTAFESREDE
ncbi:MAG TPA: aspartate 1-decarboxylase [Clostridiales bacterium]|nr:aspartate 1-decarboxylase [Clostridiales bacterium]